MEWSEESKDIRAALFAAQGIMSDPVKNAKNPHHGNEFANLESVLAAVKPVLQRSGLLLLQPMTVEADGMTTQVTEVFHVESGQWVRTTSSLKASGKQISHAAAGISTYLRRYGLMSLFALATEDADGNNASAVVKERKDGRTPEERLVDALGRTGVAREDLESWCAAHNKPAPELRGSVVADWLLGNGAATVMSWAEKRDAVLQEVANLSPSEAEALSDALNAKSEDGKWEPVERSHFFAQVGSELARVGIQYDDLARWCEVHGRPRPSQMPAEQRAKLVAAITGESELAMTVAEWAAKQVAA